MIVGWDDSASPMSLMRFHWIADVINQSADLRYELYKPWRHYDALVMVKSMSADCIALATTAKRAGTRVIFDANVDYYTQCDADPLFVEMVATEEQREQAIAMTSLADGVMASSRHLANICSGYSKQPTKWIPDNVNFSLQSKRPKKSKISPLLLWWSGMPQKMLDFLLIENVLRKYASQIHLHIVTNDLAATKVWPEEKQQQFKQLLQDVPHTIHSFTSVGNLMHLYTENGGVVISPRFLDGPYNLGHSEWKITLAMACGLPAIGSPVPSYQDVANYSPNAVQICRTEMDWDTAFAEILNSGPNLEVAETAAIEVVKNHYSTEVVAKAHREFLLGFFA
ncbi:MAG: hypothetical protein ABI443_13345 [Chthoniobacterales bacterium]